MCRPLHAHSAPAARIRCPAHGWLLQWVSASLVLCLRPCIWRHGQHCLTAMTVLMHNARMSIQPISWVLAELLADVNMQKCEYGHDGTVCKVICIIAADVDVALVAQQHQWRRERCQLNTLRMSMNLSDNVLFRVHRMGFRVVLKSCQGGAEPAGAMDNHHV